MRCNQLAIFRVLGRAAGAALLLLVVLPGTAARAGDTIVSAGCEYDYPPFCIVRPDGQADGFSVELLRAVLAQMGREVTFRVGPWESLKSDLAARRLQVLPLVGRTPERDQLYDFTFPYLTMHGAIVVRNDETGIRTLADLSGKRVAVMAGDNAEEFVRRIRLPAAITATADYPSALRELAAGRQDAVVMQKLLALQLMRQAGLSTLRPVGPPLEEFVQSFCFAVPKGEHRLLGLLNEGLSIVMADGTYRRLSAKWFAPLESAARTTMIIGGDANYPPYEYLDADGKPAGYNVDLTRAIAAQLAVPVEIRLGPWQDIRAALARHELDAIQGMFYLPERTRDFEFSPPHSVVSHVIVRRAGDDGSDDFSALAGQRIIVMAGDVMQDLAVAEGYGAQLDTAPTQQEALRRLAAGEGDCALVARVPALFWIERQGWNNLRVGDKPIFAPEYCYAVARGNEARLVQFSEALTALRASGEYRRIQAKWLGAYEQPAVTARDMLRYALLGGLPFLLLLLGAVAWSRLLRRQVRQRTAELQREIGERQRAEEELRRQTDNLHRLVREQSVKLTVQGRTSLLGKIAAGIAHDLNNPLSVVSGNLQLLEQFNEMLQTAVPAAARQNPAVRRVMAELPVVIADALRGCERIIETCDRLRRFARPVRDLSVRFDLNEALKTAVIVTRDQWQTKCGRLGTAYHAEPLPVLGIENDIAHVLTNLLANAIAAVTPGGVVSVRSAVAGDGRHALAEISDNGPGIPEAYRALVGHTPFTTKSAEQGTGIGLQLSYEIISEHGGKMEFTTGAAGTVFRVLLPLSDG